MRETKKGLSRVQKLKKRLSRSFGRLGKFYVVFSIIEFSLFINLKCMEDGWARTTTWDCRVQEIKLTMNHDVFYRSIDSRNTNSVLPFPYLSACYNINSWINLLILVRVRKIIIKEKKVIESQQKNLWLDGFLPLSNYLGWSDYELIYHFPCLLTFESWKEAPVQTTHTRREKWVIGFGNRGYDLGQNIDSFFWHWEENSETI